MHISRGLRAAFFCLWPGLVCATPPDLNAALTTVDARLAVAPDDLHALFNRGMLLAELGQPMAAADAFRAMLTQDPGLLRPRLELARVLTEAGDYDAARYHFEQVMAHDLPESVRRNVQGFMTRIREELPRFAMTVEMITDSNPKQATHNEEVVIGGLTYRLNNDARAESASGFRVLLNGRMPIKDAPLWFINSQAEHLEFPGKVLDFSSLQVTGGRHWRRPEHTITVEGGHHWARYQHADLYSGTTWSITDFRPLRPNLSLELGLSGLQLRYPDHPFRDAWQHSANSALIYASSPTQRWELRTSLTQNRAAERAYTFQQPQVSLRHVREWPGGWVTGLGLSASKTRYAGVDPFFAETRNETETRMDTDLTHRRLRLWRMAPRLQVGWTSHRSNIDFYDWQRAFVRLGMTAEF